ncbi:hypothetical protein BS47DRAFT_633988 [Hydnum rufescens UP504]|uniref:Helicase ATP-binding domain-containing protein n=1 Tax=Hydnum rufescens UP504 TaxID=1448309 RepID=A0A9P6BA82_9AGAM|nr:hypothetical protein BS47DRAFT_633988 [Hydnum rufescens UP504]
MKDHAPSLKVLVYEGWSKLQLQQEMGGDGETKPQTFLRSGRSGKISKKRKAIYNECYDNIDTWHSCAQNFDVIITTYNVLQSDLNVARPPVKRPRRETADYRDPVDRFRSPLIMLQFTRVIMDEVQQVGGGNAANMVSLIPRLSSLAVSGTPVSSIRHAVVAKLLIGTYRQRHM